MKLGATAVAAAVAIGCVGDVQTHKLVRSPPAVRSNIEFAAKVGRDGIALEPRGDLCVVYVTRVYSDRTERTEEPLACQLPPAVTVVTVTTPWGDTATAPIDRQGRAQVAIDWAKSAVDPLASDAPARVSAPWTIALGAPPRTSSWRPSADETTAILIQIGEAAGTEYDLVSGGPPPSLRVQLTSVNGSLVSGGESEIELAVENVGKGAAYRVIATTRSGQPELHGLRIGLGRIEPRKTKRRRVRIALPRTVEDASISVVVQVEEGNGYSPDRHFTRLDVAGDDRPRLTIACSPDLKPDPAGAIRVGAGHALHFDCAIENRGSRPAGKIEIVAQRDGTQAGRSEVTRLATGKTAKVRVSVDIPHSAKLDQEMAIQLIARDVTSGSTARYAAVAIASKPSLCSQRLSRKEFRKRTDKLRELLNAGDLTQAEFDRYEAELLECLD